MKKETTIKSIEILNFIRKILNDYYPENVCNMEELKNVDSVFEIDLSMSKENEDDITKYSFKNGNKSKMFFLQEFIQERELPNSHIIDYLLFKLILDHEIISSFKTDDDTIEIEFSLTFNEKLKRVMKCSSIIFKLDFSKYPDKMKRIMYLKHIIYILSPHIYENKQIRERIDTYFEQYKDRISDEVRKELLGVLSILSDDELMMVINNKFSKSMLLT